MKNTYEAPPIHNSNGDKFYIKGPGNGFGYYSGTLWPELQFDTHKEALRSAVVANIAYEAGYDQARRDIRDALGI